MRSPDLPTTAFGWHQRVWWLAIPIMLSNSTVPLVGAVDTAVMGRMDSPAYLSAAGIGAILFSSIFWAFNFLRMGTGGLIAQAYGAQQYQRADRSAIRALMLAVVIGLLLIVLSPLLFKLGMLAMQGSDEVHSLTYQYFSIRIWAAPATLMGYAIIGALVGAQRMRHVFVLQLLLNLSNIFLTISIFYATDWHIKGVAIATVISEYLTLVAGLLYLFGWQKIKTFLRTPPKLKDHNWLWDKTRLIEFFNISGNLFIRTLCLTMAMYWLTIAGSWQGDSILAANIVLVNMLFLMSYSLDGFAHAAETLCGFAFGKRDKQALHNAVLASAAGAAVLAVVFTLLYGGAGGLIIDTMTTQSSLQALTREWLPWIILAPLVTVWTFLLDGIFVGTTHTREMRNSMLISLPIFVGSSLILIPFFGNHGLWLAYYILILARTVTLGAWYPRILKAADTNAS